MSQSGPSPIDLTGTQFYADPYPIYQWLREHDPVHWHEGVQAWFVTRHADVALVLRDPRFSKRHYTLGVDHMPPEVRAKYEPFVRRFGLWLLFKDGESHVKMRRLMNQGFSPKAVEALRPHIEAVTERLLDEAIKDGSIELMSGLANPLPAMVIAHMLGVSDHDWRELSELTSNITHFIALPATEEVARRSREGYDRLEAIFRTAIEARRRSPVQDEVLSLLVAAEEQGQLLTTEELCSQCILLFFAGHETTRNFIGNSVIALLRNPDQLELLRGRPELLPGAVEELLRYDSPIQFTVRRVEADVEVGRKLLKAGQIVYPVLGSANRDPDLFPDPDRLDITRPNAKRHFSFGFGAHYCLGASLAQAEGEIALRRLLELAPRMLLAADRLDWIPNPSFHGVTSLPLAIG